MGNILSSLWRLIKAIIKKIFSWIADLFGDWFLVLLLIVLIFVAPYIAAWLTSVGAPAFLVTAFEVLALATPYLTTALTWLWEGGSSILGFAWDAFKGAETGTKLAIVAGTAALIAPEETSALAEDALELASDVVGTGVGVLAGTILSNPLGLAAAAGLIWWFFLRKPSNKIVVLPDRQFDSESGDSSNLKGA